MQISLRAGERIYVNGAVLRVDRKVTLELLNNVTFLLENHVLQPEQANTPLRQLYFTVQMMLIEPTKAAAAKSIFEELYTLLQSAFSDEAVLAGLDRVHRLVSAGRAFDALKTLRVLFSIEDEIFANKPGPLRSAGERQTEASSCK